MDYGPPWTAKIQDISAEVCQKVFKAASTVKAVTNHKKAQDYRKHRIVLHLHLLKAASLQTECW